MSRAISLMSWKTATASTSWMASRGLMNCTLRIMSGRGSTSSVMSRGLSCGAESSSSRACWISAAGMTSTGNLPSASLACGNRRTRAGLTSRMRPFSPMTSTPSFITSRMVLSCALFSAMVRKCSSVRSAISLTARASRRNQKYLQRPLARRRNSLPGRIWRRRRLPCPAGPVAMLSTTRIISLSERSRCVESP